MNGAGAQFPVNMFISNTRPAPGRSDVADDLPTGNLVSKGDRIRGEVAIDRFVSESVLEHDNVAARSVLVPGEKNGALRRRNHRSSDRSGNVNAAMRTVNPRVIPRNHRVEEALSAAEDHDDLTVLHRLLEALASPFEVGADLPQYQDSPPHDGNYRTFCGT